MAPIFTVFSNDHSKLMSLHCIHTIEQYYKVLVDSVNVEYMPQKFNQCNGRFFSFVEDQWYMYDHLDLQNYLTPHILLSFNAGETLAEDDWELVYKWLLAAFNSEMTDDLNNKILELVPVPVDCPIIEKPDVLTTKHELPTDYSFRYLVDDERDLALFEVIKPNTIEPYTVVVRNFKRRSLLPFFTALYVCTSWGVSNYDHLFLVKVWDHLGMKEKYGVLNLEQRLKEDIAKCSSENPGGPEAEPEVYRKFIHEVMEKWGGKRNGEDDFVMVEPSKRKKIEDFIQK